MELEACQQFLDEVRGYFSDKIEWFCKDLLKNKIAEVCLGPLEEVC